MAQSLFAAGTHLVDRAPGRSGGAGLGPLCKPRFLWQVAGEHCSGWPKSPAGDGYDRAGRRAAASLPWARQRDPGHAPSNDDPRSNDP